MTKGLEARFAKIGSQEEGENSIVVAKFFNPCGAGTWLATEYNPTEKMFYGYANIFEGEWGYFSLTELESIRTKPFGLGIERDLHCGEKPVKEHYAYKQ